MLWRFPSGAISLRWALDRNQAVALENRQDLDSIAEDPVDQPVAPNDELPQVVPAELGDDST